MAPHLYFPRNHIVHVNDLFSYPSNNGFQRQIMYSTDIPYTFIYLLVFPKHNSFRKVRKYLVGKILQHKFCYKVKVKLKTEYLNCVNYCLGFHCLSDDD